MKASWYAEAFYATLKKSESESDFKKILVRFREVVSSRGHDSLFPFVMRDLEKILVREKTKNEAIFVTANDKSKGKWAHAYDHYEKEGIIPKRATRRDIVDESIIGGFQIRMKDTLIDGSYKKSLALLYRQITN